MAICNLAIDVRSSVLLAADTLVSGVLIALPVTDPAGVDAVVVAPLSLADCFAAFSASRFCFEEEGAIVEQAAERTKDRCPAASNLS